MRKITADYVFPVSSPPLKNGVVVIDDAGKILDVNDSGNEKAERFHGIICPGFINTHCHLELSHLKEKMQERTGIAGFIKQLLEIRFTFTHDEIKKAVALAEKEMIENGIAVVGDISNDDLSYSQKAKNNLWYHTFIEIIGFRPDKAEMIFSEGERLYAHHRKTVPDAGVSINPHAPYTASKSLLEKISRHAKENNSLLTIHNQESEEEKDFFLKGKSSINEIFDFAKVNIDFWEAQKENSIQYLLSNLAGNKILLVHNTYTSREDLSWMKSQNQNNKSQIYFCTCPNANLFIENKLPDYNLFISENLKMTVGTDSYASNWSLSVLDELKTISKYWPKISFETLLSWATRNGAEFFGIENHYGTLEKGKKPGINLIKNFDTQSMKPTAKSCVQVLA